MIDINKTYTFGGGMGVVLTTEAAKPYSVIWMSVEGDVWAFTSDGRSGNGGEIILIEVKPTRWVNVYRTHVGGPYNSRVLADTYATDSRIACVEVTEGEGI